MLRALPGKSLNTDLHLRNQWKITGVAEILVLLHRENGAGIWEGGRWKESPEQEGLVDTGLGKAGQSSSGSLEYSSLLPALVFMTTLVP